MEEHTKRLLVIIPAFNEAGSVGKVISSVRKALPEADILVVNDGSKDRTSEVAREEGVVVIDHPYNMGIGATMQTGYRYAFSRGYDVAVQIDADGQHPPQQVRTLLEPLLEGRADIVVGSRFMIPGTYRQSLARRVGKSIFSMIISSIVGQRLTDTTSGFRAVNRDVMAFYANGYPEDYPEVEALVLLHKMGYKISEVPVEMKRRMAGVSSITFFKGVYYMVKVLLAVFVDVLKKAERMR